MDIFLRDIQQYSIKDVLEVAKYLNAQTLEDLYIKLHKSVSSKAQMPTGIIKYKLLPDNVSKALFDKINSEEWSNVLNRQVQHYGYIYDYKLSEPKTAILKKGKPPPAYIQCITDILYDAGRLSSKPNQWIINKYVPGQGIGAHRDHGIIFDNEIATLSLGSTVIMEFKNIKDKSDKIEIVLNPGDLIVFGGEARYDWTHEIKKRKSDIIDNKRVTRGTRISLTVRTVKPEYTS